MAQFDKAKVEKKSNRKWYIIYGKQYSYYIWALPIIPIVVLCDKIKDYNQKRRVWSEEKATKVLDYVLPQVLEWVEEDNAFYYNMEWGASALWRKARRRDRKWAYKFDYRLHNFIKDGYENAEYIKTIEKDYYETWIKFVERT
jgi:hypothetical protein